MRIGVMGGTFDPIHLGHLRAAEEIYWAFELDRIIFVPAARPPHKEEEIEASALHRYEMVSLATVDTLYFTVSADRKSTRLNSSHIQKSRMPSSA